MSELEKTIIELNHQINELYKKRNLINLELNNINSKKDGSLSRANRYSNKVNKIESELESLKMKKLSLITIPGIGFSVTSLVLLSGAPIAFCVGILGLACAAGYRLSYDMVYHKMLNVSDERFLVRLFPCINEKKDEYENACVDYFNYRNKYMKLLLDENETLFKLENINESIDQLKSRRATLCSMYFSELEEKLSYSSDVISVIDKTISNPDKFYSNVCNGLTNKEREYIIKNIDFKTCKNCTNATCSLTDEEKTNVTECSDWFNGVEIGKSKILRR